MKYIMKIVKPLEDSSFLPKGIIETIQNEAKEQKGGFLSTLLGKLGASLLENNLAGKGVNRAGEEAIVRSVSEETKSKRKVRGIGRAGYENKNGRKSTTKKQGHKNKMDF